MVPPLILNVLYGFNLGLSIRDEVPEVAVLGFYLVSSIDSWKLDFLPFVNSPKEKFYVWLEREGLPKEEIDYYYNIVSKSGIILVNEDRLDQTSPTLFHERTHVIMTEFLTNSEKRVLKNSRDEFLRFLKKGPDKGYNLIGRSESYPIYEDHWQELYAHMAQLEKYPYIQSYDRYIDEEVYTLFKEKYSEAYELYRKIYDLASD